MSGRTQQRGASLGRDARAPSTRPAGRTNANEQSPPWYHAMATQPPIVIEHQGDEPGPSQYRRRRDTQAHNANEQSTAWYREAAPSPVAIEHQSDEPGPRWYQPEARRVPVPEPFIPPPVIVHRPPPPASPPPRVLPPPHQIPRAPSPTRYARPTVVIPPAPHSPPPVVITPHPPPPRPILRRDSAAPRHRRPSGAGSPPVVRVVPPVHEYSPPASAYARGQPAHRLPPWTWPEPPDHEPEVNGRDYETWQPMEGGPTWRTSTTYPKTRSGRSRKGSHSSAAPPPSAGPHGPPPIRSPPQERRQTSTFVANDPFRVQNPRRRKREDLEEEDEVSLNFDSIPVPGEQTPTESSSNGGETMYEPVHTDPEEKIGSNVPSEHASGHSSSGSKSSSKQSILSTKPIAQITNYVIPVVPFIFTTLVGQAYVHVLLRLPLLYFSRVSRIFEEADLSVGDLKQMALEAGSNDRGRSTSAYELELAKETPQYERLKTTWGSFIDSVMKEWETFNVISALLLSAILTILQIQPAAVDPITRYAALSSLLCALISLLYGCTYIVRFGTMRRTYKAFEWALEAKRHQRLWWNVWVMLAMPAIWLTWSIILYIVCIMSFIWRTSPQDDGSNPTTLSPKVLLIIRVLLSSLLGIGVLYGLLILNTFRRYGLVMDRTWQKRIDEWIDRKET